MKKLMYASDEVVRNGRTMVRGVLLCLLIAPVQLTAGDYSVVIGVNHSWLVYPDSELPFLDENQFRPSYSIGANSLHRIFQDVELSVGIRLFNVGRRDRNELNGFEYDLMVSHVYISLPIRVGYEMIENLYPFVSVEPGFQLHSDSKLTTSTGLNDELTFTEEMNRLNVFAGFGVKYLFSIDQQQFSIDGQFNLGLLRVSKDEAFDVTPTGSRGWADWRTREVVFHIEYYFDI